MGLDQLLLEKLQSPTYSIKSNSVLAVLDSSKESILIKCGLKSGNFKRAFSRVACKAPDWHVDVSI